MRLVVPAAVRKEHSTVQYFSELTKIPLYDRCATVLPALLGVLVSDSLVIICRLSHALNSLEHV
jgi:hypothetical protein